jgi:phosphoesterase RecJ-like protein
MEHQAAQRISNAQRILLICHVSPDGDAIGSLLALGLALRQLEKSNVVMACADPVPDDSRHLPHWESITRRPQGSFDLVVSLDCSDLDRLGSPYDPQVLAGIPIVNIDHHRTNTSFGTVNWVDPTAAATAQMLVKLMRVLGVSLSVEIATCLLNGIVTDTIGFRTSNTTQVVLEAAVEMMNAGASLPQLTDQIFNHRPLGAIRMWSVALQQLHLEGRILWSEITQEMRERIGSREDGDAGLVNFISTANEADIAVVFDELEDGQVNVSMRAAPGYDVSQVALNLGGGGHPQAAGCTVPGPLDDAKSTVLSMLRAAWSAQT